MAALIGYHIPFSSLLSFLAFVSLSTLSDVGDGNIAVAPVVVVTVSDRSMKWIVSPIFNCRNGEVVVANDII